MALTVTQQVLEAADLSATVVTPVIQDPETGMYYREFRFFGPAADAGGEGPLLLTVRAVSMDRDAVQYTSGNLTL